jgi:hypothetical protein
MTLANIHRYFHLDEVDHQELLMLLLTRFGTAKPEGNADAYTFEAKDRSFTLTVRLGTSNKIKDVSGRGIPDAELRAIESEIARALTNERTGVGQAVCFAWAPVTGTFRYQDKFQVIPVPSDAPRLVATFGDHPFLLQFSYPECGEWSTNGFRRYRFAAAYARLLNFLCNRRIFQASRSLPHTWVLEKTENQQFTSRWSQRGYAYPGAGSDRLETFSDSAEWPPMEQMPSRVYYGGGRVIAADPLQMPDSAKVTLDRVFALPSPARDRFDRALVWLHHADAIWSESQSSAFVALVTAIESLIGAQERCPACNQSVTLASVETCAECGQPRYRVVKTFGEFLDRYAPVTVDLARARDTLYKVRSSLVHGLAMLAADVDLVPIMNVEVERQRMQQQLLAQLTRMVIYNWLHDVEKHQVLPQAR